MSGGVGVAASGTRLDRRLAADLLRVLFVPSAANRRQGCDEHDRCPARELAGDGLPRASFLRRLLPPGHSSPLHAHATHLAVDEL